MKTPDPILVQLATRIPKTLLRDCKLHCIRTDQKLLTFVAAALADKLAREGR